MPFASNLASMFSFFFSQEIKSIVALLGVLFYFGLLLVYFFLTCRFLEMVFCFI